MLLEEELAQFQTSNDSVITVGVFDGIHVGHQHLLDYVKRQAQTGNWLSGVVTFRNHPLEVIAPNVKLIRLASLDDRIRLIRERGIDFVVPLTFTRELANVSARDFMLAIKKHLRVRGLVVGPDFALGRDREGDIVNLRALGKELGFWVEVVAPRVMDGEVASSTITRQALIEGDMSKVKKLLGRAYTFRGRVGHGDERGRQMGFPTANLEVNSGQAVPADGVYATRVHVGNNSYPSVTNIGTRPTFGGGKRTIEVYLLDFQGTLYGQELCLEVVHRLRPEKRFANADELVAQINHDIEEARHILRSEN